MTYDTSHALTYFVSSGYKVITFKNPYLGNTCVPFQHWACSLDCAKAVEIPARLEQISAARELDLQYEKYVKECIRRFAAYRSPRSMLSCAAKSSDHCDSGFRKFSQPDCDGSSFPRRRRNRRTDKRFSPRGSVRKKCGCVIS